MSRRRTENSISMFPFLAVLVCTMGALILLLLVTTRRIRDVKEGAAESAVASKTTNESESPVSAKFQTTTSVPGDAFVIAEPVPHHARSLSHRFTEDLMPPPSQQQLKQQLEQAEQQISTLQAEIASDEKRHQQLNAAIDELRELLVQHRVKSEERERGKEKLQTLKAQETELAQRLKEQQLKLSQLQTDLEKQSELTEDSETVLRKRESALVSLRAIAKEQEEATSDAGDKTIIEFSNPEGTDRAPIIIDVTAEGYRFLPADVEIKWDDMSGFPSNDNPLLAGVLAIHDHRHPSTISVKPYVLLLVRPSGSMPFYAAQRTLTNASIHFGYELLDVDRDIAAGQFNLAEQNVVRRSLMAALDRRRKLYGSLMAQVESLREAERMRQQAERRRAVLLPNGGIATAEEESEFEGRFYAGGQAPPRPRTAFAEPRREQGRRGSHSESRPANSHVAERAHPYDSQDIPQLVERSASDGPATFSELFADKSKSDGAGEVPNPTNVSEASEKDSFVFNNQQRTTDTSRAENSVPVFASESDRTDAQRSSDWPDSVPAHASPATRTAGTAEQSFSPVEQGAQALVADAAAVGGPPGQSSTFGPGPASTTQSWLDRFLRSVESEKSDARPNPYLLALLRKGQATSDTEAVSPEFTTEVRPRQEVTVLIIHERLFVNDDEIVIPNWQNEDRIFAGILDGLNKSLDRHAEGQTNKLWPAVKFVVSPDALELQSRISKRLLQLHIPTIAVRTIGQKTTARDNALPSIEPDLRQEPAEPKTPSQTFGRRGI